MIDLISEDQRLLQELEGLLEGLEPGSEALPAVLAALRGALRAERTAAYGVDVGPDRFHTAFVYGVGFPQPSSVLSEAFDASLPPAGSRFGYFDPARPPLAQRNRAMRFSPLGMPEPLRALPITGEGEGPLWERLGLSEAEWEHARTQLAGSAANLYRRLGLEHLAQLRVLVCEGDMMLGWVGAFRAEPFTEREQRLLQALTPAIQRRMAMDRRLRRGGLLGPPWARRWRCWAARVGRHVQRPGDARQQGGAGAVGAGLAGAGGAGARVSAEPAGHGAALLLRPAAHAGAAGPLPGAGPRPPDGADVAPAGADQRWGLTAREAQVLEHVVQGETNKAIALHLGCAERTVEVHVTHLLNKAQVESRSALISRFFQS
ncbi:helix-turn-helix transcriptional regulator [Corallococcus sp. 4LFB]|uniref:helix-turn-helix transcriptional regulator n=1 Tax=Corallococcus sp. 4LFB TaxID=3383249 RepID=UPI0039771BB1